MYGYFAVLQVREVPVKFFLLSSSFSFISWIFFIRFIDLLFLLFISFLLLYPQRRLIGRSLCHQVCEKGDERSYLFLLFLLFLPPVYI